VFLAKHVLHRLASLGVGKSRRALTGLLVLTLGLASVLLAGVPSAGQSWTASWTQKANPPWGPREEVKAAFDTVNAVAVLFGPSASQPLSDVWQHDVGTDRWTQLESHEACPPNFTPPTGREDFALEYDSINQLFWMFGGSGSGCNGPARMARLGTTPTAIVDPTLSAGTLNFYKDWTVTINGTTGYVATYNPVSKTLFLATPLLATPGSQYFLYPQRGGGTFSYSMVTRVWGSLTGPHWKYTGPSPSNRLGPAMAYSTRDTAMVMFGGEGQTDTWALDSETRSWVQMISSQAAGSRPSLAQLTNSMTYDSNNDVFILFGGCRCTGDSGPSSGDTWAYRLSTNSWTKMTPAVSPPPRQGHNLVYDSKNKVVVLFGGVDTPSARYYNDLWVYSYTTNAWTQLFPFTSPPGRRGGGMVYDPVNQRAILYGGTGHGSFRDVWALQLQGPSTANPAPALTSLSSDSAPVGGSAFTLTVTGANFLASSVVQWNGASRPTTYVRSTQLQASIPATDIASVGTAQVSVVSPGPGGGTSNALAFTVTAPPRPAPTLTSINPTTVAAGGPAVTVTAAGTNFASTSVLQINGSNRTTTVVSQTQLTATILTSDIAVAGTSNITIFTPAPGGGISGASPLTVASVNPTPSISVLSPASVTAGSGAFTVTATGTGFAAGATATVAGQARTVTVDSTTQVRIALQATDVANQGAVAVQVTNPASCMSGMCVSNSANLSVTAPSTPTVPPPATQTPATTTSSPVSTVVNPPPATTTSSPVSTSALTSPVLYFTDLASGPRSGNGDTSKGQIANQDGALVTVWGENLGTSQGTSTITLGGVTPTAIYYWGNATPPSCGAATLFNTYQKLQCIIFQVDHATSPGAQNIVVTVNGNASNPVPFTVRTTGTIWFAASGGGGAGTFASPFGSIQMGVNALNSGDILYVKDGLYATGGIVVPQSSHYSIATAPLAIVAYPGAAVQVGDSTHDGIGITCSGCGYWMTYGKLAIFGASQAVTLADNGRIVGAQIQTPIGGGAAGALGGFGSSLFILGNELTNCGNSASFDSLYHVIYLFGRRSVTTPFVESDREIGWSYFHGNTAGRAINIYNGEVGGNNPITHHRIHDNVIVDQVWDGVMFGVGVVGENWEWNDLIINVGLDGGSGSVGSRGGIKLQPADPPGVTSGLPITMHIFNNTVLNAGAVGAVGSGALYVGTSGWTPDIHNNIFAQLSGFPYIGPASPAMSPDGNPAHWSNNLWYGAGAAPAGDSNAVNADPKLVSAVSTYDLHLQATSPAIGAGVNMTSLVVGLLDFDGRPRPTTGAWGIGAYQFSSQASGSGTAGASTATATPTTSPTGTTSTTTTSTTTTPTATGASTTPTTTTTSGTASTTTTPTATGASTTPTTTSTTGTTSTTTTPTATTTSTPTPTPSPVTPVVLPPVGTWGTLPGTALAAVVWKDSQGRSVNELKGGDAWYTILNMWNGAAYRYDTDTMVFPALGGHSGGADNSVYSVNIGIPKASRDVDPTVDIIPSLWQIPANAFPRYVDTNGEYGPAGSAYPSAAHRYDGMVHIEGTDYIWVGGGPAWGPSTSSSDIFLWDMKNRMWMWMNQDSLLSYESIIAATYDPVGKRVLYMDTLGIVEWVLSRPAGQRARRLLTFPQGQDTSNRFKTLLVDVKRNRLVAAGVTDVTTGASQILSWDLTTLTPGVLTPPTGPFLAWSLVSPGFDIDVDNDRYLIYSGGNTLTWVNPATGAITLEQTTGAPAVIATNGTWGRMRYSRNLKAVIFTQDMWAGTWVYKVQQP